jgi:hypothetical protein
MSGDRSEYPLLTPSPALPSRGREPEFFSGVVRQFNGNAAQCLTIFDLVADRVLHDPFIRLNQT